VAEIDWVFVMNFAQRTSAHSADVVAHPLNDQNVAPRNSVRVSAGRSNRIPGLEFLQDLGPRGVPAGRLNATFSDRS
jgi:hypothetical protein